MYNDQDLTAFEDANGNKLTNRQLIDYVVENFDRFRKESLLFQKAVDFEILKKVAKARNPDGTYDIDKIGQD